jgi:DNA-binding CsgD family transcriptional regulator
MQIDHAERIAGLGSWEWTPATDELRWSDNHFRLFGLEPGAIEPTLEWLLAHVHADDRPRVEATLAALRGGEPRGVEYRMSRVDGETRVLRATVAAIDGARKIVGSVQDVTGERRLEREIAARLAVSDALERWSTFAEGADDLLAGLGAALALDHAVLWVPEDGAFDARAAWPAGTRALATHIVRGAARTLRPVADGDAIAIPAVFEGRALAIVALRGALEPSARLERALHGIGHELGHFLAHRRGELAPPVLSRREIEVLQLAARGESMPAIAARLHLSRATIKRHFERAYARLGVGDRAAAVGEAMRRGLIR